jgi:hypothetical protein
VTVDLPYLFTTFGRVSPFCFWYFPFLAVGEPRKEVCKKEENPVLIECERTFWKEVSVGIRFFFLPFLFFPVVFGRL